MDIGSLRQAPIAPAPEQLAQAKKIEAKPAAEAEANSAAAPAPAAVAAQKIESKPSDPDGAGRFHAIA